LKILILFTQIQNYISHLNKHSINNKLNKGILPIEIPIFKTQKNNVISQLVKGKFVFFCILWVTVLSALYSGCGTATVWEIDRETFVERLKNGERDFLRHINYENVRLQDVKRLPEGSFFYLGTIFKDMDMDEMALRLFRNSQRVEDDPWKLESELCILALLEERKSYDEKAETAERILERIPQYGEARKALLHVFLQTGREKELIKRAETFLSSLPADEGKARSQKGEILLLQIKAELSSLSDLESNPDSKGRSRWVRQVRNICQELPASKIHIQLLDSLEKRNAFGMLPAFLQTLVQAKAYLAEDSPDKAAQYFQKLAEMQPDIYESLWTVYDIGRAYIADNSEIEGAGILINLIPKVPYQNRFFIYERIGRLYRRAYRYDTAITYLEKARPLAPDAERYDRCVWFYLDCLVKVSPVRAVSEIEQYAAAWHNPSYFNDILEDIIISLTQNQRWDLIGTMESRLSKEKISSRIQGRLAFLSAYLLKNGRISMSEEKKVQKEEIEKKFKQVLTLDCDPYYRILAGIALDMDSPFEMLGVESGKNQDREPSMQPDTKGDGRTVSASDKKDRSAGQQRSESSTNPKALSRENSNSSAAYNDPRNNPEWGAKMLDGYLRYNLYRNAYTYVDSRIKWMNGAKIAELGRALYSKEMYLESVRLLNKAKGQNVYTPQREHYMMLYPRPQSFAIDNKAEAEKLNYPVFLALIRQESLFTPDIESHAGAIGLTQLMPSTAKYVAGLMDFDFTDLKNPDDNLKIGARYFRMMIDRFGKPFRALMAYNAGPSRVLRWNARYGNLPPELYLEAVPFDETRNYVKKILVSSVIYGYIYQNIHPLEGVSYLFPDGAITSKQ